MMKETGELIEEMWVNNREGKKRRRKKRIKQINDKLLYLPPPLIIIIIIIATKKNRCEYIYDISSSFSDFFFLIFRYRFDLEKRN